MKEGIEPDQEPHVKEGRSVRWRSRSPRGKKEEGKVPSAGEKEDEGEAETEAETLNGAEEQRPSHADGGREEGSAHDNERGGQDPAPRELREEKTKLSRGDPGYPNIPQRNTTI